MLGAGRLHTLIASDGATSEEHSSHKIRHSRVFLLSVRDRLALRLWSTSATRLLRSGTRNHQTSGYLPFTSSFIPIQSWARPYPTAPLLRRPRLTSTRYPLPTNRSYHWDTA